MAAPVLLVVEDLFFLARIQQAAQTLGITVTSASPAKLIEAMQETPPAAIIVDLNCRSGSAIEALRTLKSQPSRAPIPVVGFVSHVQTDLIAAARAAGCDQVLARSAFSQQLPQLLSRLSSAAPSANPEP